MCAIAGIIDLKNKLVKPGLIKKMTDIMAHRGPDGEGHFSQGNMALGHRRLSILDLSDAGSQPMFSDDKKLAIVLNGEIYNYLELKKELPKTDYKSGTDTEVLLRAYEKWGEKCLEKLNGIFAFAIWDKTKRQLFAARDRLGIKPFYYAIHNGTFYFASEIKALLAVGVPAKSNDKIIHDYLTLGYYDHGEETFFDGIKQLMPGHSLKIVNCKLKIDRYWYLPEKVKNLKGKKDEYYRDEFLKLLEDSAKIQLRSDVPIGIGASGGLDSSLVMSSINKVCGGQKNFDLFHFTFDSKDYDSDLPYAKKLARALKWSDPTVVSVKPEDFPALAEKIMWHEEQPFPGLPTVAWHKLYQRLSKTPTIVTLEGHGGDECGAGYDYYFGAFLTDIIATKGHQSALQELENWMKIRGLEKSGVWKSALNGITAYFSAGISADASKFTKPECLNKKFLNSYESNPQIFEQPFDSFLSNIQYRELVHTKLPRVLRSVDRESMAYGRELRVPLLDHRLVEFAFSLPLEQRIRGGQMRFFMRNAGEKLLPDVISKTPKRSLPNPQRQWFQKELRPWIRGILSSKSFGVRKYFNQKAVLAEYDRYCREKNPVNSFHIWQWINLELWLRKFID